MKTTKTQALTFKSERAAKVAFTKAINIWEAKRTEAHSHRDACRYSDGMACDVYDAHKADEERCEAETSALLCPGEAP